ncbi:hypothetical protein CE91St41_34400 [Oscillospiraceae bacterium]|nr:hypothetical protein CE91St40_34390 [Oscillospiraceae bacterium]BDF76551.1 hypothetical protein CE91St41_34400 [Oscillospiraceae bacterium]
MNNIESKLKTASVGGFVKKDVIAYIEGMEQEYRTKLGTLERILAATQASRSEVEQKLQAVLAGQGQESGEVQRLNTAVQDLQGNLELLKNELSSKDAELENARGELRQLSARLAEQEQGYGRMIGEMNGELEQLRARLEEAERRGAASAEDQNVILMLRGEIERLQKTVSELQMENQALREQVKAAGEAGPGASVSAALLLDLQSQLDQRNRQLIAMSEEMEQLHSRNKEYEASMAQFGSIQARAEQIEEVARKKAEEMVTAAASESSKLKADLDAWLREMESSYAQIKQEAAKSVSQAYEELEKTRAAMDELALRDEKRGFPPEKHMFEVIHGHGEARNA